MGRYISNLSFYRIVFAASASVVGLMSSGAFAGTVDAAPTSFTDDAGSGIVPGLYSHKLDFIDDNSPAVVNGVTFRAANQNGMHWSSSFLTGQIDETNTNAPAIDPSQATFKLLHDFYYNGSYDATKPATTTETVTLTGLIPGAQYDFRTYWRAWGAPGTRFTNLAFDEGTGTPGSKTVDEDAGGANYLTYHYTAGPTGTLVTTYTEGGNAAPATWHQYAMTNRLTSPYVSIAGLFNTGVTNANDSTGDNTTPATTTGVTDAHYLVNGSPAKTATDQGAYFNGGGNSTFINDLGSALASSAAGAYTYETTFTLATGLDPNSVILQGGLLADDRVTDIIINGHSTGITMTGFGLANEKEFTITDDFFKDGLNTIDFVTNNDGTNPQAFRVDGLRGYALEAVPEPGSIAIIGLAGLGVLRRRR